MCGTLCVSLILSMWYITLRVYLSKPSLPGLELELMMHLSKG